MQSDNTLTKREWDLLYHLLRRASMDPYSKPIALGLAQHLLSGPDYPSLLNYSSYYGSRYLLPRLISLLRRFRVSPRRIVELGAGRAWLGRGLSEEFGVPLVTVDKRREFSPTLVLDLESQGGLEELSRVLKDQDLIVMADFLHCLDSSWEDLFRLLSPYSSLVLEYLIGGTYGESFKRQIEAYGGNFRYREYLPLLWGQKRVYERIVFPYEVWLAIA